MGVPRGFAFGFDALWLAAEEYVYRIDSQSHQEAAIRMPSGRHGHRRRHRRGDAVDLDLDLRRRLRRLRGLIGPG